MAAEKNSEKEPLLSNVCNDDPTSPPPFSYNPPPPYEPQPHNYGPPPPPPENPSAPPVHSYGTQNDQQNGHQQQSGYQPPAESPVYQQQPIQPLPSPGNEDFVACGNVIFGKEPIRMKCTAAGCGEVVTTEIRHKVGSVTCLAMGLMCLLGLLFVWFPIVCVLVSAVCFWIPLCMDSTKNVVHVCPKCGERLGVCKRKLC